MVSFRPLGNILLTDLHKKTTYNKDQMAPIICRLFILTATMLFSIVAKKPLSHATYSTTPSISG